MVGYNPMPHAVLGGVPGALAVAPFERRHDPISLLMAYRRVRWIIDVWIIHKIPAESAVWPDKICGMHFQVGRGGVPSIKT